MTCRVGMLRLELSRIISLEMFVFGVCGCLDSRGAWVGRCYWVVTRAIAKGGVVGGVRVAFATWGGVASEGRTEEGEVAESIGDKRDMNNVEGECACECDINDSDDTAIGTEDDDEQ